MCDVSERLNLSKLQMFIYFWAGTFIHKFSWKKIKIRQTNMPKINARWAPVLVLQVIICLLKFLKFICQYSFFNPVCIISHFSVNSWFVIKPTSNTPANHSNQWLWVKIILWKCCNFDMDLHHFVWYLQLHQIHQNVP